MSDIGCHLWNDGNKHTLLHAGGILFHQFGTLAHITTHTLMLHLWTREIQLHGVTASLFGHFRQSRPLLFGLSHNRGNYYFRRIVLFQPVQNVEVHLNRILTQLFHVAETIEVTVSTIVVHGVEAW